MDYNTYALLGVITTGLVISGIVEYRTRKVKNFYFEKIKANVKKANETIIKLNKLERKL
jgi:hypothetical protein